MIKQPASTERVVQATGAIILTLLIFIPVSNAVQILTDTNLSFWLGKALPWTWLSSCVCLVLLYLVTTQLFFVFAQVEWRNDATLMYMARTFLSALAVGLIMQSYPLYEKSGEAAKMLLDECSFNSHSSSLQRTYEKLRAIRDDQNCANQLSVRACEGFVANDYTEYLAWVEEEFQCTGMCSVPKDLKLETVAAQKDDPYARNVPEPFDGQEVATMETPSVKYGEVSTYAKVGNLYGDGSTAPGLLQENHTAPTRTRALLERSRRTANALTDTPGINDLVPVSGQGLTGGRMPNVGNALFSHYTYDYHCAHMAASDLRNRGNAIADATFIQGVALLTLVIGQSVAELVAEARKMDPGVTRASSGA
jgi:hypothetical protein